MKANYTLQGDLAILDETATIRWHQGGEFYTKTFQRLHMAAVAMGRAVKVLSCTAKVIATINV
jgi:hypothetical protein